ELQDSNDAFANLIPTYVPSELPFGNTNSAWCKVNNANRGPDNNIGTRNEILAQGENTYAYVQGLSETSNASWPIMADGFASGSATDPAYSKVEGQKGAVWKGKHAIVIRNDGSGVVENVDSRTTKVLRKGP